MARTGFTWLVCAFCFLLLGCAHQSDVVSAPVTTPLRVFATGQASYYGPGFDGKKTANGETFDRRKMTAAHRTLPFGTMVRVTNTENSRSVVVRINDRYMGRKRVIDLSEGAFARLAPLDRGVIPVRLDIVEQPK